MRGGRQQSLSLRDDRDPVINLLQLCLAVLGPDGNGTQTDGLASPLTVRRQLTLVYHFNSVHHRGRLDASNH